LTALFKLYYPGSKEMTMSQWSLTIYFLQYDFQMAWKHFGINYNKGLKLGSTTQSQLWQSKG